MELSSVADYADKEYEGDSTVMNSISSAVQTPVAVQPTTVTQTATKTEAQPVAQGPATSIPVDTVQISSTAAALSKELTETPAQTTKEAGAGDIAAQKLLAKEAARK